MAAKSRKRIGGSLRTTRSEPVRRGRPPQHSTAEQLLLQLGSKLKSIREDQDLTIAQVARKTDIAPQTIIQLENTGRPIKFTMMHQIAESLGYKLELRLSKPKNPSK